jgi:predicted subunit of tRNA(5-methylaminomethyl-2-thiouridylate) methyltransferase
MTDAGTRRDDVADAVYRRHVQPLEARHRGKYVLVAPDGNTILTGSLLEAVQEAHRAPSKNNYIFMVGEKAVGRLR